jgi:hypothetical protein
MLSGSYVVWDHGNEWWSLISKAQQQYTFEYDLPCPFVTSWHNVKFVIIEAP